MNMTTSCSIVGSTLAIFASSGALAQAPAAVVSDAALRVFLPRFEEATRRFINGDATLWKEQASRHNDVTIIGSWGAYEKGWKEVGARYDWAAERFK